MLSRVESLQCDIYVRLAGSRFSVGAAVGTLPARLVSCREWSVTEGTAYTLGLFCRVQAASYETRPSFSRFEAFPRGRESCVRLSQLG